MTSANAPAGGRGFPRWAARTGTRLPGPAFIFLYLIGALIIVSLIAELAGLSALQPIRKNEAGARDGHRSDKPSRRRRYPPAPGRDAHGGHAFSSARLSPAIGRRMTGPSRKRRAKRQAEISKN